MMKSIKFDASFSGALAQLTFIKLISPVTHTGRDSSGKSVPGELPGHTWGVPPSTLGSVSQWRRRFNVAVEAKLGGHGSTESVKLPRNFDVAPTSNKTHIHTTCNAYRHCPLHRHDPTGFNMIEHKSETSARSIWTHNI